jgi:hypothetical protein
MTAPRFIEIRACPGLRSGGKRHLWRDIVKWSLPRTTIRGQEQRRAAAKSLPRTRSGAQQPALFELRDDCRPATDRSAAGRYREPSLFSVTDS